MKLKIPHSLFILMIAVSGLLGFLPQSASAKNPLKVYILAGQSNMQGHAHIDTMDVIGLDPKTAPMLKEMRNSDGTPKILNDVWVSSLGSSEDVKTGKLTVGFGVNKKGLRIGPEYTFGIYIQKHVKEPILIIKTAWGGKSLSKDFRPPSAGPFPLSERHIEMLKKKGEDTASAKAARVEQTGHYYRLMTEHVQKVLKDIKAVYPGYDPKQGYELAGFVWFQGWNDLVDTKTYPDCNKPGGYDAYTEVLGHFIRDVRKEFAAPKMPFVIGVMGVGGPVETYTRKRYINRDTAFRKAMAAPALLPEFKGNVSAVLTENYWDQKLGALKKTDFYDILKKHGKMKREGKIEGNGKKELEAMRAEVFTKEERDYLNKGSSNAGYHYHGSAKILGQIGKAFADELDKLSEK
ncbi:MAG: sialate O-acetylesterase [Akkermansiaceae bacterium]